MPPTCSCFPPSPKRSGCPRSWASYGWPLIVARVVDIYDQLAGRIDRQRAART